MILDVILNEKNQIEIIDFDIDEFNYNEYAYNSALDKNNKNLDLIRESLEALFIYEFSPEELVKFFNNKRVEIVYEDENIIIQHGFTSENFIFSMCHNLTQEIHKLIKKEAEKCVEE